MHAVGRIAYRGDIDNIQVSWVKMGVEGARQVLRAGANDMGGTLMDENISRAAGATHGQRLEVDEMAELVAPLGRPLVQRTTLYGRLPRWPPRERRGGRSPTGPPAAPDPGGRRPGPLAVPPSRVIEPAERPDRASSRPPSRRWSATGQLSRAQARTWSARCCPRSGR